MSRAHLPRTEVYLALVSDLRLEGYRFREEMGGKHGRLIVSVNGREEVIIVSTSPSDRHASKNASRYLRRRMREWKAEAVAVLPTETAPARFPTLEKETMDQSHIVPMTSSDTLTMSSREIAELVEKRHDSVKRTMEMLQNKGLVRFSHGVETSHDGAGARPVEIYTVGKRDSYIIVAQLSPEFTARLVDRWQELEAQAAGNGLQPARGDIEAMHLDILALGDAVKQLHSMALTGEFLDRRLRDAMAWQGNKIVDAIRASGLHLSEDDVRALVGGTKKVLTNRRNWEVAGVLPSPAGDEFEFRSTDELLCEIIDADAIHSKLSSWVSTNVLIPHAREEGWPQRQSERRSRSHRAIVLFPMLRARAFLGAKVTRDQILRQNASFWDGESARRRKSSGLSLVDGGRG